MDAARRRVGGLAAIMAFLLIGAGTESGQAQNQGAQVPAEEGTRVARATRVERAPRMDGTLDDPIWQQGAPITNFRQREPYEGQPATESTEVRVLYRGIVRAFRSVCTTGLATS